MKHMLQAEQTSGLVRTSPTDNSGAENHPKDDTVHNGEQQQAESDLTEAELVAALLRKGCVLTPALVGPNIASSLKSQTHSRSADARRKARERQEKLDLGWKQLNVNAPSDDEARGLLAQVAKAIQSKHVRRDILAVLADRELVTIGRKVRRLRGEAADQVRMLLKL
jgi:hypothetical protein